MITHYKFRLCSNTPDDSGRLGVRVSRELLSVSDPLKIADWTYQGRGGGEYLYHWPGASSGSGRRSGQGKLNLASVVLRHSRVTSILQSLNCGKYNIVGDS